MSTYRLDDWDDIRVFLAVALSGSFITAAQYLGTSQSTISRRIQELELRLGAKLFDRSVRGARLTPQGRTIQDAAKSMEHAALNIEKGIAGVDREMRGTVTITATEGIGAYWLAPRLLELQRRNPGLCISLDSTNALRNLDSREADIALRFGRPNEPTYRMRKVANLSLLPHASKTYLREFGRPEKLEDFRNHYIVDNVSPMRGPAWETWNNAVAMSKGIVFKSNSPTASGFAIREGYGIGLIPRFSLEVLQNVEEIPIDIGPSLELWAVTHEQTGNSRRVRVTLAYIYELFQADRYRYFDG
ncbi:MAG: LysR family transcriptional regulator [Proteobacteria bacterium]|nr:LysR family transcriptional regulator [Pseudomonadota bacterium]